MTPRNFPPAPGWSPDGHRIKVPSNYDRGPPKVWVYGALSVRDGQALTQTARSRNTSGYLELLQTLDRAYPTGELYLIADNLASHTSGPIREWLHQILPSVKTIRSRILGAASDERCKCIAPHFRSVVLR